MKTIIVGLNTEGHEKQYSADAAGINQMGALVVSNRTSITGPNGQATGDVVAMFAPGAWAYYEVKDVVPTTGLTLQ